MFLKSLTLTNLLSFGSTPCEIALGPLNVIIGPNGSGKSNLIDAISLLQAAPTDIRMPIRSAGGVSEWLWKGGPKNPTATIEAVAGDILDLHNIRYRLSFVSSLQRFEIFEENIDDIDKDKNILLVTEIKNGNLRFNSNINKANNLSFPFNFDQSILSQIKFLTADIDMVYIADRFDHIRIFREFPVDRDAPARMPQKTDLPNVHLTSDASNLGLVLNRLRRDSGTRLRIKQALQTLYERIDDIDVQVEGGTVQVFVYEGQVVVPATRLSSGTLRFLCLLAILCHPEPPSLICLEEPELGLHPDIIPMVAQLLKEASTRTQLVVTTHSEVLVDALSDRPEAVLVAEKGEGGTTLTRLDPEKLKPWLTNYRLGQLWTRGEIGGTRW